MIGMPASIADWMDEILALVSRAARQIAVGFLAIAVFKYSTCCAIADSLSGPWKVTSTPNSLAAFCVPSSTAFQN